MTSDYKLWQLDHDYGYAKCRSAWKSGQSIIINPMPPGTGSYEGWDRARREIALEVRNVRS